MDVGGLAFNRGVNVGERIAELAAEVKRLNDSYYGTGDSPLPDADYDALKDELAALVAEHPELEPADSPLGKVNAPAELTGPTVRHARPMLSLAKATRESQRQVNHPLHGGRRKWLFAGLARLVAREPFDALRHEPRLPSPHHGLRFARSAHDLSGAAAVRRRENDGGAPHVLLRRAAIRDDRLKPMAIRSGDVHDNACSHDESLNCFGQFGNRPNESDH